MRAFKIIALLLGLSSPLMADINSIITFPDGTTGDVQFNQNRRFTADDGVFTYSTSTKRLTIPGVAISSLTINGVTYTFPFAAGAGGTYWRNDGAGGITFEIPSGSGSGSGSSSLAVLDGGVQISSPTDILNFNGTQFVISLVGGATAFIQLNTSSVTVLGPTIELNGSEVTGSLPAASVAAGSLGSGVIASSIAVNAVQNTSIVAVAGSKVTGDIPGNAAGITGTVNVGQVVGHVSVYPATNTASFPYGLSASTVAVSTANISGRIVFADGTIIRSTAGFASTGSTSSLRFQTSDGTLISGTAFMVSLDTTTLIGSLVGGSTVYIKVKPDLTVSTLTLAGMPLNTPLYLDVNSQIAGRAIRLDQDVAGVLPVEFGGTGQTEYTDGQFMIGNSATGGLSTGTITAGTNITVTNGNGTITIAASGGGGGGGDSLGTHIATQTVTANYGLHTTTVTATAFDATGTSMTVTGSSGLRVNGPVSMVAGSSITNTTSTQPLYIAYAAITAGNPLLKITGDPDLTANSGITFAANSITFKDAIAGPSANFSITNSGTNIIQYNGDTSLCSDASTTCRSAALGLNQAYNGNGAVVDSIGKINTGGVKHKTALLRVGGSALISSNYSDLANLPSNGMVVEGSLYTGSTTPTVSTQFSVIGSTANNYTAFFSTTSVGGSRIAISTSSEILLNASAGTSGQVLTSAGVGTIPTWSTASGNDGTGYVIEPASVAVQIGKGLYIGTNTITAGSAYTITSTDTVVFAQGSLSGTGSVTYTLPTAASACRNATGQTIQITKVDTSTGVVIVKTEGTDLIAGTTGLLRLNAIGQTAELISDCNSKWWPHGQGIQQTPTYIGWNGDGGNSNTKTSSTTYICPMTVSVPVAVMGFTWYVQSVSAGSYANLLIYDANLNLVVSTGPVLVGGFGFNTITTTPVNLPPGQYYYGWQQAVAAVGISDHPAAGNGGNGNAFCSSNSDTDLTPPNPFVLGTASAKPGPAINVRIAGGRTGL